MSRNKAQEYLCNYKNIQDIKRQNSQSHIQKIIKYAKKCKKIRSISTDPVMIYMLEVVDKKLEQLL